jgi:hypothetical protein
MKCYVNPGKSISEPKNRRSMQGGAGQGQRDAGWLLAPIDPSVAGYPINVGCNGIKAGITKGHAAMVSAGAALCLLLLASPASAGPTAWTDQAKAALLVKSDFPSSWISRGSVTFSTIGADYLGSMRRLQHFATCVGESGSSVKLFSPVATSAGFETKNGHLEVRDEAMVSPSPSRAQAPYAEFSSPKGPACWAASYQSETRQQITQFNRTHAGQKLTLGNMTPVPPDGSWLVPHSIAISVSAPFTNAQGFIANDVTTVIVTVRGRITNELEISSLANQFPVSLAHYLVATAARRT